MSSQSSACSQSKPDSDSDFRSASARLSREPYFLSLPTWASEKTQTRNVLGVSAGDLAILAASCASNGAQAKAVLIPKAASTIKNSRLERSPTLDWLYSRCYPAST